MEIKQKITKESRGGSIPFILFRPKCWVKSIFRSIFHSTLIEGHNYYIETLFTDAEVEVLKCEDCGKVSIGYIEK